MNHLPFTPHSALRTPRSGGPTAFTLVEMLIAMTLTLILVTAIAEFYAIVGESVKDGRSMIELSGQLRAAVQRLQNDLDQLTVTVAPWSDDGSASGYFEYYEGPGNDYNANGNFTSATPPLPIVDATEDLLDANGAVVAGGNGVYDLIDVGVTDTLGDGDDFLAFTIRSPSQPLTGRATTGAGVTSIVTSQFAEVIWWVGYEDRDEDGVWDFNEPRFLYRRQLLILPYYNNAASLYSGDLAGAKTFLVNFYQKNDISVSVRYGSGQYTVQANTISGIARREQRFAHEPFSAGAGNLDATFPHAQRLLRSPNGTYLGANYSAASPKVLKGTQTTFALHDSSAGGSPGEDVVMANLLAFDVQAFDPYARVWPVNGDVSSYAALVPSDPGYPPTGATLNTSNLLGLGGFVDLHYYRNAPTARTVDQALFAINNNIYQMPFFADAPTVPSNPIPDVAGYRNNIGATYDTWALSYERDGLAQNQGGLIDEGTDGLDNPPNQHGVDDPAERETVPPYNQPLRGLQVRIRVYEPSTRQVRQATVATDFVTE